MRYGMMIELDKCIGCRACVSACKERWDSGPGAARCWVHEFEQGRRGQDLSITFYPGLCMQCDGHPCTQDCPTGATYQNENGVVVVDSRVCIGCGNCVSLCPYQARHTDPQKGITEKCNLCAPYVARGELPACVTTCLAECRIFGDLDDPQSAISQKIRERKALPLITDEINVGPRGYYAPEPMRQQLLAHKVVRKPVHSALTAVWQKGTRPLAQLAVPALSVVTVLAGSLINLRSRGKEHTESVPKPAKMLLRHRLGMRFLHWFNALSWVLLLVSGTALLTAPSFALFGTKIPSAISQFFGGQPSLLRFHIVWGLLWALIIVPLFLYYKRGGLEALEEIRIRRDDLRWLAQKPLHMLGFSKEHLPPQDKYNAGQKLFAVSALLGTSVIILTGLIMAFHLGTAATIAVAIVCHKLAIAFALLGLSVHITMAALLKEERPALGAMLTGQIDRAHAQTHSSKWVTQLETSPSHAQPPKGSAP